MNAQIPSYDGWMIHNVNRYVVDVLITKRGLVMDNYFHAYQGTKVTSLFET